jgi:hypothetical protein
MRITSIHRETTQTMNLNQIFLLLIQMPVHGCSSYSSLHALLLLLFYAQAQANVTMIQRGCLYLFSLLDSKAIKSRINSYLPALSLLNADYLLRTRAIRSRSPYNVQRHLLLNDSFKICATVPKQFKMCAGLSSWFPLPRWLACCVGDAPASYSSA